MRKGHWIVGILIVLVACAETLTSSYATMEHAKSAGAIQRGWVPDNLPAGATEIHETHNIDTNVMRGSFQFSADRSKDFENSLQRDLRIKSQDVRLETFGARAHDLKEKETTQSLAKRGYQLFNYHGYCFAVHWDQGHGFYWNCK